MVLRLKAWESKSSPGLQTGFPPILLRNGPRAARLNPGAKGAPAMTLIFGDAGWSSPVARQAHNLKVAGSNPAPATNKFNALTSIGYGRFCLRKAQPQKPRGQPMGIR